jgi:glycosyltransferase involved in cell wall biosynthesis
MQELLQGRLRFIYSADYVPERCHERLSTSLGAAVLGLRGEWRIGPNETAGFANRSLRVVHQPGLGRAIAEHEPDVVVGDGFFQWTSAALGYCLRRGAALVVCYERTFHTERSAQSIRTFYRRQVLRRVDAMACNGKLSREYSISLGMDPLRITVGQMAADSHALAAATQAVTPAERSALRDSWGSPELVLVSVGRLNDRKGNAELLRGWQELERRRAGRWRLILVGDGPDRPALERQARELGLQSVIFAGHIDYSGIARFYAAADALVMPTLEDNWSLVVPEAMACGLPVLTSVYNGCHPELIAEGENGWIFDPLDRESTATALTDLVDARERLPAMGRRSREIEAQYTPAKAAKSIVDACRIALEHRRGAAR